MNKQPNNYQPRYNIPREPSQKVPNKDQKTKFSSGTKAFLISLVLIALICVGFIAKKKYQQNKKLALEDLQAVSEQDVDLNITYVNPEEVYRKLRDKNAQLVDIREVDEFATKHIESSINVPLSRVEENINLINTSREIYIIDRQDNQIGKVFTNHLANQGVNVKYLQGGILNYSNSGYNLISKGNPTLTEDLVKVTSLSSEEILEKIRGGKQFIFIDVRPEVSYFSDNIEGSINIPLERIEQKKMDIPFGTILVYDSDSIRSFQAAVRLHDLNFLEIYNSLDSYELLKMKLTEAANQVKQVPQEPPAQ